MACSISLDYWFAWPIRKYCISILKIRVPSAIALSMFYSIKKKIEEKIEHIHKKEQKKLPKLLFRIQKRVLKRFNSRYFSNIENLIKMENGKWQIRRANKEGQKSAVIVNHISPKKTIMIFVIFQLNWIKFEYWI